MNRRTTGRIFFVTQKDENMFRPQGAERIGVLGILFFSCFFSEFISSFLCEIFYTHLKFLRHARGLPVVAWCTLVFSIRIDFKIAIYSDVMRFFEILYAVCCTCCGKWWKRLIGIRYAIFTVKELTELIKQYSFFDDVMTIRWDHDKMMMLWYHNMILW